MNDKDIIEYLENEIKNKKLGYEYFLGQGHYPDEDTVKDIAKMQDVLDLINRQKAEIERLKKHNTEMSRKHYSDGIKEFAEKLKEQFSTENHTDWVSNLYFPNWMAQIDNLVKKMTEETP